MKLGTSNRVGTRAFARPTAQRMRLFVAVFILALILPQVPNAKVASVDDGGYPWANATELNAVTYDWGYATCPTDASGCMTKPYVKDGVTYGEYDASNYYFRNCTSYVAWKIKQVFGTDISGWGGGESWDNSAPSSKVKDPATYTPVAGDIAQWDSPGHVAYVTAVNSGIASLAEYNVPGGSGSYKSTRTTAPNSVGTPSHYIHIGTVTGGGTTGSPARSDVDNNGGADLFAMVASQTGSDGYSLVSDYQRFYTQYWWNGAGYGWSGVTPLVGDVKLGDKKADLVFLTNEGANGTKAFVSQSGGAGFGAPQLWWTGTGYMYSGIKASLGDVDNNGCEDLVLTTNEATGVKAWVLLSTCQGFLAPQMAWDGVGIGWGGMTPMVGDAAEGDKKADYMFITDEGASGAKAFVAKSDGAAGTAHFSYTTPQPWHTMTGFMYSGIKTTIGDTDGNGCTDLVLTTNEATGSKAWVLLSTCQSLLGPQLWWDGMGVGWAGMTPFTGDTDNDKRADFIFMTDEGVNGIKVFDAHSSGNTGFSYTTSQPWVNVPGWAYSGIKAYLK